MTAGPLVLLWLVACGASEPVTTAAPVPPPAPFTGPWVALDGTRWLLPSLDSVALTVPDRPHAPHEVHDDGSVALAGVRARTFTLSTTTDRLRTPSPPPGTGTLLVALGDATTFGWGVDAAQAWPALLGQRLGAQAHGVRVLNAGVPGAQVRDLARWCEATGPVLGPAWIIWSARPHPHDRPPFNSYFNSLRRCTDATGARVLVALPPVSVFDLAGRQTQVLGARILSERVQTAGHVWLDLGDVLAGDADLALVRIAGSLRLTNRSGDTLLAAPEQGEDLPQAVLALLQDDPALRETGLFDQRHPDAEGHDRLATAVALALGPLLAEDATHP